MTQIKNRAYISILLHVLVWVLFAFSLLFYHPLTWGIELPLQFWIKQSGILLLLIAIFYLNSYVLVPQLLLKNKNMWFAMVILAVALLAGPLARVLDNVLDLPNLMQQAFNKMGVAGPPKKRDAIDLFLVMMVLLIAGISTSFSLIQKRQLDKQAREAEEKERIGSELSFLKAQINPHFFFNTLNNIYALTHVDVENSRRALHKLSRMMRYLLYETQSGNAPLAKEISFINDYIELMKLRLNDTMQVRFEAPEIVEELSIAPMLFLPCVENAFKHGVSTTQPSQILIQLTVAGNELDFKVSNTIFNENALTADEYGGIGLSNTKRRLELLYPGRHTFLAQKLEDSNEFIVHLKLVTDGTQLHSGR
ncbi:histidine kinase [Pedobacter sp. MC2016-14]|uniref:sensor histidine kinase n=1 Tax=Pedobacter sp. MC2016-14 TaxID=2897327 RepID=UPI001E3B4CED|nr:histidine kinase [Pedobacter sp. MC2016-14]MCD0487654.1 histidine kinase [Pedobacter sp. MC2016-14]